MITMWDVYWISRLDGIKTLLFLLPVILGAVTLVLFIRWADFEDDRYKKHVKVMFITALISTVFFIPLATLIPSTQDAVAIYMIPKIVNNEQIQKLPDNAAKLLNEKLESWIKKKK